MPLHEKLLLLAILGFLLSIGLEVWWDRRRQAGNYQAKDAFTSLGLGVGFLIVQTGWGLLIWAAHQFGYSHRLFDIPLQWWSFLLLVVLEDHSYYWFHRMSHEIPLLWAAHVPHHSSEHYTLATALRQPWTVGWYAWLFWTPLAFLGFHPRWILTAQSCNLLYQYWVHSTFIPRLGAFEWIFNTASHHRVHHGTNPQYIDRNHAGIFIIWDRIYRTFEPEKEQVMYGITRPVASQNLLWLNLHEYVRLWKVGRATGSVAGIFRTYLQPHGRVQLAKPAKP